MSAGRARWHNTCAASDVRSGVGGCAGLIAKMGLAPIYQRPQTSNPHPEHRIIHTYCAIWRSPGRAMSGAPTLRTCRCGAAFSIWSRSWTGRAERCSLGGCRIRWTRRSASGSAGALAGPRSSTRIRASVHQRRLHRHVARCRSADQHGRTQPLDGQRVLAKRLWRSLKYECVYLNAFETGSELRAGLGRWLSYYNGHRPHSRFAGRTQDEVYGRDGATPYPGHAPDIELTIMTA